MNKIRILVVEDEWIVSRNLKKHLEKLGYDVIGLVASGEEAIDFAVRNKPDIVTMDIVLEGNIDGIEAARDIRARVDIPIIFLTAHADNKTLDRAKIAANYGVGYLIKPFEDKMSETLMNLSV